MRIIKGTEIVPVKGLSLPWRELIAAAEEARQNAHAPYSDFLVGAALRTSSGRVYAGCNIENASFGMTVCAERVAIWKAVSEGEKDLESLVVVTPVGATPCGACRQVMSEFSQDMPILVADTAGHAWRTTLQKLLPAAFPYESLAESQQKHKA